MPDCSKLAAKSFAEPEDFSFAFVVMDIHARVANPRSLENGMAGAGLSWLAKKGFADLEQFREPDIGRFPPPKHIFPR
jgi:hypothetical protein